MMSGVISILRETGQFLSVVAADNFSKALDVVKNNYGNFNRIKAFRAIMDSSGNTIKQNVFSLFQIMNMMKELVETMAGNSKPNNRLERDAKCRSAHYP